MYVVADLRVSTACEGVLGLASNGTLGQAIDVLFIFGWCAATSLGIGIPMISAVASDLIGVERGMTGRCHSC